MIMTGSGVHNAPSNFKPAHAQFEKSFQSISDKKILVASHCAFFQPLTLLHFPIIFVSSFSHTLSQGCGAGKFFSGSGSWLFFQAAPAPDFFPNRLRLLVFFSSGSGSGSKEPKTPGSGSGSGSWLLVKFAKIFFSQQTSKVKRQKNIKQVK